MKVYTTEAIVLRRTNYGEADRIVGLLTPDKGKISVIAKGVRRQKSKLAGGLELFATTTVTVREGRGDMGLVTSARLTRFYGNVLHDYERMQLGYEIVKRVNRVAETLAEPEFYYLLRDAFSYLDEVRIDIRLIELWFRLWLAGLLGQGVNLTTDSAGDKLRVDGRYGFDFNGMAFAALPSGEYDAERIKFLRLARAKNPLVLSQVSGVEDVLADCLRLVRMLD